MDKFLLRSVYEALWHLGYNLKNYVQGPYPHEGVAGERIKRQGQSHCVQWSGPSLLEAAEGREVGAKVRRLGGC